MVGLSMKKYKIMNVALQAVLMMTFGLAFFIVNLSSVPGVRRQFATAQDDGANAEVKRGRSEGSEERAHFTADISMYNKTCAPGDAHKSRGSRVGEVYSLAHDLLHSLPLRPNPPAGAREAEHALLLSYELMNVNASDPRHAALHAHALFSNGKLKKCVSTALHGIANLDSTSCRMWHILGECLYYLRLYPACAGAFAAARELCPLQAIHFISEGDCLVKWGYCSSVKQNLLAENISLASPAGVSEGSTYLQAQLLQSRDPNAKGLVAQHSAAGARAYAAAFEAARGVGDAGALYKRGRDAVRRAWELEPSNEIFLLHTARLESLNGNTSHKLWQEVAKRWPYRFDVQTWLLDYKSPTILEQSWKLLTDKSLSIAGESSDDIETEWRLSVLSSFIRALPNNRLLEVLPNITEMVLQWNATRPRVQIDRAAILALAVPSTKVIVNTDSVNDDSFFARFWAEAHAHDGRHAIPADVRHSAVQEYRRVLHSFGNFSILLHKLGQNLLRWREMDPTHAMVGRDGGLAEHFLRMSLLRIPGEMRFQTELVRALFGERKCEEAESAMQMLQALKHRGIAALRELKPSTSTKTQYILTLVRDILDSFAEKFPVIIQGISLLWKSCIVLVACCILIELARYAVVYRGWCGLRHALLALRNLMLWASAYEVWAPAFRLPLPRNASLSPVPYPGFPAALPPAFHLAEKMFTNTRPDVPSFASSRPRAWSTVICRLKRWRARMARQCTGGLPGSWCVMGQHTGGTYHHGGSSGGAGGGVVTCRALMCTSRGGSFRKENTHTTARAEGGAKEASDAQEEAHDNDDAHTTTPTNASKARNAKHVGNVKCGVGAFCACKRHNRVWLPPELWLHVAEFLDGPAALAYAGVCRGFRRMVQKKGDAWFTHLLRVHFAKEHLGLVDLRNYTRQLHIIVPSLQPSHSVGSLLPTFSSTRTHLALYVAALGGEHTYHAHRAAQHLLPVLLASFNSIPGVLLPSDSRGVRLMYSLSVMLPLFITAVGSAPLRCLIKYGSGYAFLMFFMHTFALIVGTLSSPSWWLSLAFAIANVGLVVVCLTGCLDRGVLRPAYNVLMTFQQGSSYKKNLNKLLSRLQLTYQPAPAVQRQVGAIEARAGEEGGGGTGTGTGAATGASE